MKHLRLLVFASVLSKSLCAQWTEFNCETIDFETTYNYLFIDTSINNIWQICEPNKLFFNSALSESKAIVTDSNGYYPIKNHSFFDIYIGDFNIDLYPEDIFIEIEHKYDTDPLKDGGFITVSYDLGKTWMNIINDSVYMYDLKPNETGVNLYTQSDLLFNGENGFSGKSNGWVTTQFSWYVLPCKSIQTDVGFGDTMIIRFNFVSDSVQNNKEGWMIDDIRLFSADLGGAIDNKNLKSIISIYPNPVNSYANIELDKTYSNINIDIISIGGQVIDQKRYTNTNNIEYDFSKLGNGMFIIRVLLNKKIVDFEKIIIRK